MVVLDVQQYEYMMRYSRQAGLVMLAGSHMSIPAYMMDHGYAIDFGSDVSIAVTVTNVRNNTSYMFGL